MHFIYRRATHKGVEPPVAQKIEHIILTITGLRLYFIIKTLKTYSK
jgi:hypothetical protein